MSNSNKIIIVESIVIILLCLFLFNKCNSEKPTTVKTKFLTERKYYPQLFPIKLDHYLKGDSIEIKIPAVVDTDFIIRKYFTQFNFNDSIRDTNIFISSQVQIARNTILKSDIKYKLLKPITSTTITIENTTEAKQRPVLLIGSDIGFNNQLQIKQFSPSLLFVTKNKKVFGAGYDFVNQTYQAKVYLPLFK